MVHVPFVGTGRAYKAGPTFCTRNIRGAMKSSFSRLWISFSALLFVVCSSRSTLAAEEFRVGEQMVIAQPKVELKRGTETVATLSDGQRLKILQTDGEWLGTSTTVNGRTVTGWIQKRQVLTPAQYTQRPTTRRSSSYQPAPATSTPSNSAANRGSSRSRSKGFIMGQQYGSDYWRAGRKINGY